MKPPAAANSPNTAPQGPRLRLVFWAAAAVLLGGVVKAWPDPYAFIGWGAALGVWAAYGRATLLIGDLVTNVVVLRALVVELATDARKARDARTVPATPPGTAS